MYHYNPYQSKLEYLMGQYASNRPGSPENRVTAPNETQSFRTPSHQLLKFVVHKDKDGVNVMAVFDRTENSKRLVDDLSGALSTGVPKTDMKDARNCWTHYFLRTDLHSTALTLFDEIVEKYEACYGNWIQNLLYI